MSVYLETEIHDPRWAWVTLVVVQGQWQRILFQDSVNMHQYIYFENYVEWWFMLKQTNLTMGYQISTLLNYIKETGTSESFT